MKRQQDLEYEASLKADKEKVGLHLLKLLRYITIIMVINVKKILAVINVTYAVAKRKPEKIRLAGVRTLTSAIPVQRSNQLS